MNVGDNYNRPKVLRLSCKASKGLGRLWNKNVEFYESYQGKVTACFDYSKRPKTFSHMLENPVSICHYHITLYGKKVCSADNQQERLANF